MRGPRRRLAGTVITVRPAAGALRIRCPRCKKAAELAPGFASVKCAACGLDMTYGEYVRHVAHSDKTYSDILGDYAGATEGETAGTLDEWDEEP